MTDHPITPPPELVQQWLGEFFGCTVSGELADSEQFLATRATQWGADQELEACCGLLVQQGFDLVDYLRAARRPKPPSLKEQAMQALCRFMASEGHEGCTEEEVEDDFNTIRRALEQLDD
jgi:hypothetical protein